MISCGWLWIYAGAALMLFELVAPVFILCFFGLSAASVGVLRFAFGDAFSAVWQLASFSALSIIYIALLRHWLKRVFVGDKEESKTNFMNEAVGRVGKVTEAINPPLMGRVMIGDAEWNAEAAVQLPAGTDIRVVSQSNLTLAVEKI